MLPSVPLLGCGGDSGETASTSVPATTGPRIYKDPAELDRFIDALPLPAVGEPDLERYTGVDYYEIRMSQIEQEVHSQLPPATLWGYGGASPGPTIEARRGRPVRIRWINDDLPGEHLLAPAIDRTLYYGHDLPDVRTVTHLHGGFTPPRYDGQPDAWSSPGAGLTGAFFTAEDFIYGNEQPATMLWYHDHAMASTRLNVYAGLAGLYLIRDDNEDSMGLPSGEFEVPLVIQDRDFAPDGSLSYPVGGETAEHPVWVPFFLGDIPLVNGRAYPFLEVEPRRYRLRLLNGSQARVYNLRFDHGGSGLPFHVIGTDGGFLERAVPARSFRFGPAERADIIIDFAGMADAVVTLANDAAAPYPDGTGNAVTELMQLRVARELTGKDGSTPAGELRLPATPSLSPTPGAPTRVFNLDNIASAYGPGHAEFLINNKRFNDPVEERPAAGTTEIWEFVNLTLEAHPVHIHLVQFQVLDRQPLDGLSYWYDKEDFIAGRGGRPEPGDYLSGPPVPPPPEESGWKDTALSMPGEILRLLVPFDLPPDTGRPARYIYHCHILEHEDNEMMRPFEVV